MTDSLIILLPLLFAFGLLYWSSLLDEDNILKLVFQGLFIPMFWVSAHFAVMFANINYPLNSELVSSLADFSWYLGFIMLGWGIVYVFKILKRVYDLVMGYFFNKKQERYGDGVDES